MAKKLIRKYFFIIFVGLFGCNNSFSMVFHPPSKLEQEIDSVFNEYIFYHQVQGNDFINQFEVYVIYIYDVNPETLDFCFTLGAILNAIDYELFDGNIRYFKKLGDEYFLVKMKESHDDLALALGFEIAETSKLIPIVQKMYPPIAYGFTYRQSPAVGCFEGGKVSLVYSDEDTFPFIFKGIFD